MKFRYRRINLKNPFNTKNFILRPIIPLSLWHKNKSLRYEALIDSGADFNIFPLQIAEDLGIKFKDHKKILFKGIGGDMGEGIIGDISLELGGRNISTKAVFADVGNGVLGQYGFFDICTVNFNLKKKIIEIEQMWSMRGIGKKSQVL